MIAVFFVSSAEFVAVAARVAVDAGLCGAVGCGWEGVDGVDVEEDVDDYFFGTGFLG